MLKLCARSANFLYLSFGAVAGTLVGPAAAGVLMEKISPWFPILSVFAITPFVFGILLFIPETLPVKPSAAPDGEPQTPLGVPKQPAREALRELFVSLALLKNRNVLLSMVGFFIAPALFAAHSSTLSQYVSKYFGWTLAQTSYVLGPPLSVLHLVIIVLIPHMSSLLTAPAGRFRLSVFSKDLLITKVSLLLIILGSLMEGVSQGIVLFIVGLTVGSLGSAHGPLLRAVATSYVEPNQTSRLYSLISMLETAGALIGGPVLAKLFSIGLAKRGLWIGLPWFYVAALVSVALTALMFLQRPKKAKPQAEEEGMGEDIGYSSAGEA